MTSLRLAEKKQTRKVAQTNMPTPWSTRGEAQGGRFASKADPELIAACLSGDAQAWDALIDRYEALIYSVLVRSGLSQADADDLFQDVCLILYNHLGDLRDTARLSSWLISTAKREVWRLHRRRKAHQMADLSEREWEFESAEPVASPESPQPEASAIALEEQHLVRLAMSRMQDRCKQLLTMLYMQDPPASYQDVSSRLSLPAGSIGPTRARCLQKLRDILNEVGF
jgi:RNA polymerase sigma factor (sigma-70 family)